MAKPNQDPRIELFDKSHLDTYPKFFPEREDRRLFEAIKNHELIIFYGAGVSILAGCASWTDLANRVIRTFSSSVFSELDKTVLRELSSVDPRKAISICNARTKGNPELESVYHRAITDAVKPTDAARFINIHEQLSSLNPTAFITTNIDKGIEQIGPRFLDGKKIVNMTTEDIDAASDLRNGNIFYLHGSIDSVGKAILTIDQYLEFYYVRATDKLKRFLKEVFCGRLSVLFLGYSLSEYEIIQNIYQAVRPADGSQSDVRHFLLTPIYSRDIVKFNIERDYFRMFSVRAIPYFIDHEGYSRLDFVLKELRRHIASQSASLDEMAAIDKA